MESHEDLAIVQPSESKIRRCTISQPSSDWDATKSLICGVATRLLKTRQFSFTTGNLSFSFETLKGKSFTSWSEPMLAWPCISGQLPKVRSEISDEKMLS